MKKFWQHKSLQDMSNEEWESLCDGCARCCLRKLQDEDTDEIFFTNIACHLLDEQSCRCKDYEHRQQRVAECVVPDVFAVEKRSWLPSTCAYRSLAEGKELMSWHPLVSGNRQTVHDANISVRGKAVGEAYVHPDAGEDHIITWVNN